MTRRRRPGAFETRSNDVADDDGTLTLEQYRRDRGLDPEPAPRRRAPGRPRARAMSDRQALVRLALDVADDLDARAQPRMAGLLRQLARLARLTPDPDRSGDGGCRDCGGELTGRQRAWCSEACRRRHRP